MKLRFKFLIICALILSVQSVKAQNTYLQLGTLEYHLLDRLETKQSGFVPEMQSSYKPISRKAAIDFLNLIKKNKQLGIANPHLTPVDEYDIKRAISISSEWTEDAQGDDGAIDSKHSLFNVFYTKQSDFIHVHTKDFFLVVNPVLYVEPLREQHSNYGTGRVNTRGLEIRGRINDKIGFYTYLADNQEKPVSFIQDWSTAHNASPGVDFNIKNGANYDIFNVRGYFDVALWKNHINLTFGYDKNFLGDGIRSLVLSDFSAPTTFLKIKGQFGNISYQSLYMELTNQWVPNGDNFYDKKYAAIHSLGYTPYKWLNVTLFESTIFGKLNSFNPLYLQPVIGINRLATAFGRNSASSFGFNIKVLPITNVQLYTQMMFNEIDLSNPFSKNFKNQWAAQIGAKYFDVAGIQNLDIQLELNAARPFMYSANDTIKNYTNFNQPLAHPFGSAFAEGIFDINYQPYKKLYLSARGVYSKRGVGGSDNMGNDIFLNNNTHNAVNYSMFSGDKVKGLYGNLNAAYELRPNLFIEAGVAQLERKYEDAAKQTTRWIYGGIRLNISRRQYDFY